MENLPVDCFVTSQAFAKSTLRDVYPAIDPSSPLNNQAGKVIGDHWGIKRVLAAFAASFAKASPKATVLIARNADSLEAAATEIQEINDNIEVLVIPTNILSVESVSSLWDKVKARLGHTDVLVNNAGLLVGAGPVSETSEKLWWTDFELNGRGTFLVTQGFLQLLGKENKGTVINLTSVAAAVSIFPHISSYSISKLIPIQLAAYTARENPNVTAVALHPSTFLTDMTLEVFKRISLDTPEFVGGIGVWLATKMTGKYISANWSVEQLVEREEEITSEKLSFTLAGDFGQKQFA